MAKKKEVSHNSLSIEKSIKWVLIIGGILGLMASFMLTIERFDSLQNPNYIPVCNLNPILNCGTVSTSKQAEAFGFYNPFLGLVGYTMVLMLGLTILAGGKLKKWFWQGAEVGLLFAFAFVTWLQFQTLYRIGALCIFCMVAWVATIPSFWYLTIYNLREGNIKLPDQLNPLGRFIDKHHTDILITWFVIIIALIAKRFWYYWSTLL